MQAIFVFLFFIFSFVAQAAEPVLSDSSKTQQQQQRSSWGGMLAVGSEIRAEHDVNGNPNGVTYLNLALGARYRTWYFVAESVTESQSSGNATLSVEKKVQDILGWAYWAPENSWYRILPLIGGGVGAYQTKVTTTLSGVATNDESPWKLIGGGAFGFKLDVSWVWLSIEGRVLGGDEFDPQPTLSGLARLGLSF